ncbi:MAG: phosphoribosylamine--glycine ligase [bacterium]
MFPKVLVIGSGGREHALVKQLALSPQAPILYALPGNPGTAACATNLSVSVTDITAVVACCLDHQIDLVVIGPEDPLIAGMADGLREAGIAVFGPDASGARLEGDKEFAKEVMAAAGVPTAAYRAFSDRSAAVDSLAGTVFPVVVKACGAAQGKGVAVCADRQEAVAFIDDCLLDQRFGAAGGRIIIETCLTGPELSVLAITDGKTAALLAPSRDHKRIGEGDVGPNTGGMGAFAPVLLDAELAGRIEGEIVQPILAELAKREMDYRGVLYAGLMLTPSGPQVLEFNCRFGDPETQVVLPLLNCDFLALLQAAAAGSLAEFLAEVTPAPEPAPTVWPGSGLTDWERHCIVVVGAADGYPGGYAKGVPLILPADEPERAWTIQAGTALHDGTLVTNGGRVLGAVGAAATLPAAREAAYDLLERIKCTGLVYRRDIAATKRTTEGSD